MHLIAARPARRYPPRHIGIVAMHLTEEHTEVWGIAGSLFALAVLVAGRGPTPSQEASSRHWSLVPGRPFNTNDPRGTGRVVKSMKVAGTNPEDSFVLLRVGAGFGDFVLSSPNLMWVEMWGV